MKYSDGQRIRKIYENAVNLNDIIVQEDIKKELLTEIALQWMVTIPLYNMGEHACHLSEEYKNSYK